MATSSKVENMDSDNEELENDMEEELENDVEEEEEEEPKKNLIPGIVYINDLPFMTVPKIRTYFSNYGEVGRIRTEGPIRPNQHVKKIVRYKETWVEFLDKNVAKKVASSLNNNCVGGRKRTVNRNFIWHIKYLPKFTWDHLTRESEHNVAMRKQRLMTAMGDALRCSSRFSQLVDEQRRMERTGVYKKIETKKMRKKGEHSSTIDFAKAGTSNTVVKAKPKPISSLLGKVFAS